MVKLNCINQKNETYNLTPVYEKFYKNEMLRAIFNQWKLNTLFFGKQMVFSIKIKIWCKNLFLIN